ncbi:MAG: caspase family protein [Treponema sp.]|jgi:WD40 repeat protein|nr:caspase family protein [Treponema sp.]
MKLKRIVLLVEVCLLVLAVSGVWFAACASGGSGKARGITVEGLPQIEADIEVFPQLGHSGRIHSVAISPDGKQLIIGSVGDRAIKLWDITTGREIKTFVGDNCAVLSPDGKMLLSGSNDSTIKLWDIATGNEIRTFVGHTRIVNEVAFSPDGKLIISGSWDQTMKLWDVATGIEIRTFTTGHKDVVSYVSFSPNGAQVLSGSFNDKTVKLWDVATGIEIKTFSNRSRGLFSPDGRKLLLFGGTQIGFNMSLLDITTDRVIRSFDTGDITVAAFNSDGKMIISGNRLWDTDTGNEINTFKSYTSYVNNVAFNPDGKSALLVFGSEMKLLDMTTGKIIQTFSGRDSQHSIAFNSDGKLAISGGGGWREGSYRGTVTLWDVATGHVIKKFTGHTDIVYSVAFSPDGKMILSGSGWRDPTIKLWDAVTGYEIRTFSGHKGSVDSVAFSPDGKMILSGSNIRDCTVKLWDVATGREIRTFAREQLTNSANVTSVAFSPDGKLILSGYGSIFSSYCTAILWDLTTGQEIRSFNHIGWVNSVSFSPDGRQIITNATDAMKLWDLTGQEIKTFIGGRQTTFRHDGKKILAVTLDNTIRLWDIATSKEIAQFISFSGSDSQLAAASRGLTVETQTAATSIDGEWLAITPDGYYQASPRGDRFLNVRVGNTVSGIDAYRSIFYNPDVVQARLQGLPDPASKANISIQQAAAFLPPTVTIQSPANFTTTNTATTNLSVNITDQNQAIQNIKVFVNGRPAGRSELAAVKGSGLQSERASLTVTGNQRTVSFELPLSLDPGNNRIEVVAFNGYSENRRHIDVTWNAPAGQRPALPNLWVLAVGVNNYDNAGLRLGGMGNLRYCAADAKSLVDSLKAQEGRRYTKVNALLLTDGESVAPTAANIRENLKFLDQAGERDVVLLFLAGHGLSASGGKFFFLPKDAVVTGNRGSEIIDEKLAISGEEITAILEGQGNRLLFIDACQSGGVDNNRMIRSMMESNAFVFAASQGNELSYEDVRWGGGHGVFTYSILNALRGAPAALAEGNVSVRSMSGFVSLEVPRQTENRQNPKVHSLLFADFPMAVIRD